MQLVWWLCLTAALSAPPRADADHPRPPGPEFDYHPCLSYAENRQWQRAAECYEQGFSRPKRDAPTYHNLLAVAYHEMGDFDRAIQQYLIAIEGAPQTAAFWSNLGLALRSRPGGRPRDAVPYIRKALRLEPRSAKYASAYAYYLFTEGKFRLAKKYYKIAVESSPNDPTVWNMLGVCYSRLRRLRRARWAYRQTVRLSPRSYDGEYPVYAWNLGLTLLDLAEERPEAVEEAARWMLLAWEARPEREEYALHLARAYTRLQRYANASRFYAVARQLSKSFSAGNLNALATAQFNEQSVQFTEKEWHHSSIDQNTGRYSVHWPNFYITDLTVRDAITTSYSKAAAEEAQEGTYLFNLGAVLYNEGRYAEAVEWMGRGIALQPRNAGWRSTMANALIELQEWEMALEHLEVAAKHKPDQATYHYNKGRCLFHLKRFAESAKAMERAAKHEPDNSNLYIWWGSALINAGYFEEGRQAYKKGVVADQFQEIHHIYFSGALHSQGRQSPTVINFTSALM
eukprot:EG_transcript_6388